MSQAESLEPAPFQLCEWLPLKQGQPHPEGEAIHQVEFKNIQTGVIHAGEGNRLGKLSLNSN